MRSLQTSLHSKSLYKRDQVVVELLSFVFIILSMKILLVWPSRSSSAFYILEPTKQDWGLMWIDENQNQICSETHRSCSTAVQLQSWNLHRHWESRGDQSFYIIDTTEILRRIVNIGNRRPFTPSYNKVVVLKTELKVRRDESGPCYLLNSGVFSPRVYRYNISCLLLQENDNKIIINSIFHLMFKVQGNDCSDHWVDLRPINNTIQYNTMISG